MKKLIQSIIVFMLMSIASNLYAQNWIPYQENTHTIIPVQSVYIYQPQPTIVYQWIPYVSQQNIIVEQQRLFCRTQTVVNRPFTQWVLQPVVVYR